MKDRPRNYQEELADIHNALAESVLTASDAEIEEEVRMEGLDPHEEAERVRDILREAVRKHQGGRECMNFAECGNYVTRHESDICSECSENYQGESIPY